MKISFQFDSKESWEKAFLMNIEKESLIRKESIIEELSLYNNFVSHEGKKISPDMALVPMVDILRDIYKEKNDDWDFNFTDTDFYDTSMKMFRRLHDKLGISKDFIDFLKIENKVSVTNFDREFLVDFFSSSSPQSSSQKPFKGTVNEQNAGDLLWKADGIYRIYCHMKLYKSGLEENKGDQEQYSENEVILKKIEKAIVEKTNYPYWKEKIIGERLIKQIRERIDAIIDDRNLEDDRKRRGLEDLEKRIAEALIKE